MKHILFFQIKYILRLRKPALVRTSVIFPIRDNFGFMSVYLDIVNEITSVSEKCCGTMENQRLLTSDVILSKQ